jgi:hypothetical protein
MIFVRSLLAYILIGVIVFIIFNCAYLWSINHNTAFSEQVNQATDKTYQDMGFENSDDGLNIVANAMKESWVWLMVIITVSILFWPVSVGMVLYNYLKENKSHQ